MVWPAFELLAHRSRDTRHRYVTHLFRDDDARNVHALKGKIQQHLHEPVPLISKIQVRNGTVFDFGLECFISMYG